MDVEKTLSQAIIFSDLAQADIRRITQICSVKKVSSGELIVSEGDPGDTLFLVAQGNVRIFRAISETYSETLAMLDPGGVFGEMSFIDRVPRSSSAMAEKASTLLELGRSDFDVVLQKQPQLASKVLKQIASLIATRIRSTDHKISEVAKWVEEIAQCSYWSLDELPEAQTSVDVYVQGNKQVSGRVVGINQNEIGYSILLEHEESKIAWIPYHALYYLRVPIKKPQG
jgi:CRP-like cAMP-binding protein